MEKSETNPQTPLPPETSPHKHFCCSVANRKCNCLFYCLAAFLILVILSGVVYLYHLQNQSPVPVSMITETTPIPTTDPTANWKTYTNTEYNFELKYPPYLNETAMGPNQAMSQLNSGQTISGTVEPSFATFVLQDTDKKQQFEIGIFTPYQNEVTQKEYREGLLYTHGACDLRWGFTDNSIETINISNVRFLKVTGISSSIIDKNSPSSNTSCYYLKAPKGNLIVISALSLPTNDNAITFDQILSTFRFLDSPKPSAKVDRFLDQPTPTLGR